MSDEINNIQNNNKDISDKQLMAYLEQQIQHREAHELEAAMAEDPFMSDAVEGLEQLKSKKNIAAYVEQLNHDLQKQLHQKKQRKAKRKLAENPVTYFAIVFLLVICIAVYVMLKTGMLKKKLPLPNTPPATTEQVK